MSSVFISYSHPDEVFVEKLINHLTRRGIKTWQDKKELNPGARLIDHIYDALDKHEYYLVVLSATSVVSPWVHVELLWALEKRARNERLIQVALPGYDDSFLPRKLDEYLRVRFDGAIYKDAFDRIARCILQNPSTLDAILRRAQRALADQRFDEAILTATQALDISPTCVEALNLRARAQVALLRRALAKAAGSSSEAKTLDNAPVFGALNDLDESLRLNSSQKLPMLLRAELRIALTNWGEALQDLKSVVPPKPEVEDVPALKLRGRAYFGVRDYQHALNDLTLACELRESDSQAHSLRGQVLFEMERWDEAVDAFSDASRWNGTSQSVRVFLARSLDAAGRLDEAITICEQAIEIDGADIRALGVMGRLYYKRRKYAQAERAFTGLLKLSPNDTSAMIGRGWTYLKSGKISYASQDADAAVQITQTVPAFLLQAECAFAARNWSRSMKLCQWIGGQVRCARALELRARIHVERSELDAAKDVTAEMLDVLGIKPDLLDRILAALFRKQRRGVSALERQALDKRTCEGHCCGNKGLTPIRRAIS